MLGNFIRKSQLIIRDFSYSRYQSRIYNTSNTLLNLLKTNSLQSSLKFYLILYLIPQVLKFLVNYFYKKILKYYKIPKANNKSLHIIRVIVILAVFYSIQ